MLVVPIMRGFMKTQALLFTLTLSTLAFAQTDGTGEIRNEPKFFLKDEYTADNIGRIVFPTISIKKRIELPASDSQIYFQSGQPVSFENLNKEKPHCAISGANYKTFSYKDLDNENKALQINDIIWLNKPFVHRYISSEVGFDQKALKFSGVKSTKEEYSLDFGLRRDFVVMALNQAYLDSGLITKNAFPNYDPEDKKAFSGKLVCQKFSSMPTVKDLKDTLGPDYIAFHPDEDAPMEVEGGNMFRQFTVDAAQDEENTKVVITMLNKQLEILLQTIDPEALEIAINDNELGKDPNVIFEKLGRLIQKTKEASKQ